MNNKFIFILLCFPFSLASQNEEFIKIQEDSIQKLIYSNSINSAKTMAYNLLSEGTLYDDSLKISLAWKFIGNLHILNNQVDSSILSYKSSIKFLGNKKNKLYADNLANIGGRFSNINKLDSMEFYLTKAKKIYTKTNNIRGLCFLYNSEAMGYYNNDKIKQCEKSLYKLIFYAKKYEDKNFEARAYFLFSVIHARYKNYEQAKNKALEAAKIFKTENNNIEFLRTQNIISTILLEEENYEELGELSKRTINFIESENIIKDMNSTVFIYSNYIKFLIHENKLKKADSLLVKMKAIDNKFKIVTQDLWMVELSLRLKQKQLDNFKKLLTGHNPIKLPSELKADYYKLVSEYYFNVDNQNSGVKNLNEYVRLNDSLKKIDSYEQIAYAQEKFESEKKEKENLALKAEKANQEKLLAQQTKRNWQLGGGLATAVLGLGIFFIFFRRNQKQKKVIELQKNKVELLQKELHHRLKNNLSFIDVFISLAKGKFTDPSYQEKLNELQNRIKSMFEVHEQLFEKENITTVNASAYISKLANNVKTAYNKPNISIEQHIDKDEELDSQTSFPLGIIINEFVTNSYKYAFDGDEKGIIKIILEDSQKGYNLTLSDNGKGLPSNFDINNTNTFGLDSIKLLTQEYKGSFAIHGNEGMIVYITLPKQAA